jgi:hypothetical protein
MASPWVPQDEEGTTARAETPLAVTMRMRPHVMVGVPHPHRAVLAGGGEQGAAVGFRENRDGGWGDCASPTTFPGSASEGPEPGIRHGLNGLVCRSRAGCECEWEA